EALEASLRTFERQRQRLLDRLKERDCWTPTGKNRIMAIPADHPAMVSDKHMRFDEFEDGLASGELVALLPPFVREEAQYWKWIMVGAHSALQGAMVCAYVDSSGTSILKKKPRGKKRKHPHHEGQLADFEDLLKCCVRGSRTCEPLVLTHQQRRD